MAMTLTRIPDDCFDSSTKPLGQRRELREQMLEAIVNVDAMSADAEVPMVQNQVKLAVT